MAIGASLMATVAVAIPTYPPRASVLHRALVSIQSQTRQPDQIIIQMDNEGVGAAVNRNRAWQAATTDFVAFLDDDDELYPNHLEALLGTAEAYDADFVYPWFELYNGDGVKVRDPLAVPDDRSNLISPLGVQWSDRLAEHMHKYAFIPITTLVRKSALEISGGFPVPGSAEWPNEDCEDWGCWLRLLDSGAKFVHAPFVTWRCNLGIGIGGKPWKSAELAPINHA